PPWTSAHSRRLAPPNSLSSEYGGFSKFHSSRRPKSGRSPSDSRKNRETVTSRFKLFSRPERKANLKTRSSRVLGFSASQTSRLCGVGRGRTKRQLSRPGITSPALKSGFIIVGGSAAGRELTGTARR